MAAMGGSTAGRATLGWLFIKATLEDGLMFLKDPLMPPWG